MQLICTRTFFIDIARWFTYSTFGLSLKEELMQDVAENEEAFAEFMERKALNRKRTRIHNEDLPAGSDMHFDCKGCQDDIVVLEDYETKPEYCSECQKLVNAGLLENFKKRAYSS